MSRSIRLSRRFVFPNPRLVFEFLADAEAALWKKVMLLAAVVYMFFPLDFVPDLVPLWGWLDDMGVASLAVAFLSWVTAPYADDARRGMRSDRAAVPVPVRVRDRR